MIDTQKDIRITERNPSKSHLPRITYIEIPKNLLKSNNRLDYLPAYPRSRNSLQNVTLSKYQAPEVLAFWLVTICWYMRQTVKKSKVAARERRQDESKNAKTGEKETARGEQEKENEKNSDEREAGKKKGMVGKSGTRQEKGNCGTETPEKAIAKNKSQAGKTVRKGNGAKAEIRRALSSHQYKGDVRLWLLEEHLTSEAFDIHRLPPGIISKLADGRCWRGEGAGFPGEVSANVSFSLDHLPALTSPTYIAVCIRVTSGCCQNSLCRGRRKRKNNQRDRSRYIPSKGPLEIQELLEQAPQES